MLGKDSFLSGLHSTMVTNYKRAKNSDMPCPYSTNLPNCFSLTSTVYWKRASQGHLSLSQKDKSKCAFQTQVGVVGLFTREEFWLKLCISRQFGRQDSTIPEANEPDGDNVVESQALETVRGKCITQLLLLEKILGQVEGSTKNCDDGDIALCAGVLWFLYLIYQSKNTLNYIPSERPPLNLLRQELAGTSVYLDILHKTTTNTNTGEEEKQLEGVAEEKLISFFGQVLKDASDVQLSSGESASSNVDVHRVLQLRSPVIVKVIKGTYVMNSQIFRKHVRDFYPLITKLVCCDQAPEREGALSYAYAYKQRRQSQFYESNGHGNNEGFYGNESVDKPKMGWNWLEHWMLYQLWQARKLEARQTSYASFIHADNMSEKTVVTSRVAPSVADPINQTCLERISVDSVPQTSRQLVESRISP